jgi:hypothetical protein
VKIHLPDWKWAGLAAFCLLGIAALVIFVFSSGGFEEGPAWFYFAFPGAFPAALVSDLVYESSPRLEPFIYWALVITLSFVWYWAIFLAALKFRKLLRTQGFR